MRFGRRRSDVGTRRGAGGGHRNVEKSGVSPGRNGGSGTCSASFGRFGLRGAGSLSLMWLRRLVRTSTKRQLARVDLASAARLGHSPWPKTRPNSPTASRSIRAAPISTQDDPQAGRRHPLQRKREDQRRGILRLRRLDQRRGRPQPRPLRQSDDPQAQGQGRALYRDPPTARLRTERRPKDRTGCGACRLSHIFFAAQPAPSASAERTQSTSRNRRDARADQRALARRDCGLPPSLR